MSTVSDHPVNTNHKNSENRKVFWFAHDVLKEFLLTCEEKNYPPSLDFFTLWMDSGCSRKVFERANYEKFAEK